MPSYFGQTVLLVAFIENKSFFFRELTFPLSDHDITNSSWLFSVLYSFICRIIMRFVLFFFWQFRPQFTLNPLLFRDLTVSPRWIRKPLFLRIKQNITCFSLTLLWINNLFRIANSSLIHFFREFLINYLYRKLTMFFLFIRNSPWNRYLLCELIKAEFQFLRIDYPFRKFIMNSIMISRIHHLFTIFSAKLLYLHYMFRYKLSLYFANLHW